jgi:hypothetical protein
MGNLLWALTELDPYEYSDDDSSEQEEYITNKPTDGIRRLPMHHLLPGPWDLDFKNHPELQYQFYYKDYDCAIRRGGMWAWCGYVKIPETHPYYDKNFDDMDIDVHGGFTGGDDEGRIGFDTCHAGDIWPSSFKLHDDEKNDHYWTYEDTIEEVKKVVDQLIEKENQ